MKKLTIQSVTARWVFDSRANPTVEAVVTLENGAAGRGIAPSGASTGAAEALELRDGDKTRFGGKGVLTAVKNVNELIAPVLLGMDISNLRAIDEKMIALDGTENKSKLGANAILACSIAAAFAGANASSIPLYRYLGKENGVTLPIPVVPMTCDTDIQDYQIVPLRARSFKEAIEVTTDIYRALKSVFQKHEKPLTEGSGGGLWPTGFRSNTEGIELLIEAIEAAGLRPMVDAAVALDVAASEIYDPKTGLYRLTLDNKSLESAGMVDMLERWVRDYPLISIEDGCSESDWDGAKMLTERIGRRVQLVGDDLFTTNPALIQKGIDRGVYNAVLIKMNQIGTVSETLGAIQLAQDAGYGTMVSCRSGETEDTSLCHLAVATNAGQVKCGMAHTERTVKWNEFLRIEDELGDTAVYPSFPLSGESSSV